MKTIKGPAVFLAQFLGDEAPFNNLKNICEWAAGLGYKAVQIPAWDKRVIDIEKAGASQEYCDEIQATVRAAGLEISELSTHLQGQLVAVHPAYDSMFDGFAPAHLHGKPKERTEWAINQVKSAASASKHLGLSVMATFSGSLLFHTMYPWPQRPAGLVEVGFEELAKRWLPILDHCHAQGVELCYEIHPGEDLHDGVTFERFLEATNHHPSVKMLYDPSHFVLQQLDYLQYIDIYHEYIRMFHVKDAEFNPSGRSGVYGGYQDWIDRPGRFRSLGDGQVDFKSIFTKLSQYGYDGWAVMEWECCIKSPEQGAKEGAPFIASHIIEVTDKTFDDFAGGDTDEKQLKKILGLGN
ncbi:sugar phosphate isomerase/epimerase [Reichenbachiella agarivorans]|uniref:Sugar phosphate isomerase/epimerase n=1 Tax=Reichenbachiella agarivorans TaxID=2979464 RepID=A0ABY6CUE3_9BACT|nr:sugar phosphate isomerase/epimerase [Reichenbachiella agarivorans]UXP34146.1 sugar phosphate isomerase/epimerase [Reichenbachiella agarivorans]